MFYVSGTEIVWENISRRAIFFLNTFLWEKNPKCLVFRIKKNK